MPDYKGSIVASTSGKYAIYATVNCSNQKAKDYALVRIHLMDSSGKELLNLVSPASDAMKWSLGWMPNEEIVVLQSSDVGTMAFEIKSGKLVRLKSLNDAIEKYADQLYKNKYGT